MDTTSNLVLRRPLGKQGIHRLAPSRFLWCAMVWLGFWGVGQAQTIDLERIDRPDIEIFFYDGVSKYERGEFGAAAAAFQRAVLLHPHPDLLYNIARSQERAGHGAAAIAWYTLYKGRNPIDASAILQRIVGLRQSKGDQTQVAASAGGAAEGSETSYSGSGSSLQDTRFPRGGAGWPRAQIFWGAAGLGLTGFLTGMTFGGLSLAASSDADSAGSDADRARLERLADSRSTVGLAGLSVGAIGLGLASWLWFGTGPGGGIDQASWRPTINEHGASVVGSF